MNRRILFVTVLIFAVTSMLASAYPANALVINGKKNGGFAGAWADEEAVACLQFNGYTVNKYDGWTVAGAAAAIVPSHQVVVIIGHGAYFNDKPLEGVLMEDGEYFCSDNLPLNTTFPDVKQLFLISCGQLMPDSWQTLFPNARIYGFPDTVSWLTMWWSCGKLPVDTPSTDKSKTWDSKSTGSTFVLAEVHPSLQAVPHTIIVQGKEVGNPGSPLNPLHQPETECVEELGARTFNLWVDSEILVGIQADGGVVVDYVAPGDYPSPDFEVGLIQEDYLEALRCPISLDGAFTAGRIWIGNNSTNLSDDTLYCAVAGLLFGITDDWEEDCWMTTAWNPRPPDGAEHVPCDVNEVCFQPPINALVMDPCADPNLKGPFDFYVYFKADDPCNMPLVDTILDVNTADQICSNIGAALPGVTYYWRVDINDHNEPGDPCFYEGPVFSFTKWGYALYPIPEDEAVDVFPSTDPNWQNDGYAAEFDVFFGTNKSNVDASEQGALVGDTQGFYDIAAGDEDEGIEPGALEFDKTYYWRVDECNDPCGCVHGNVWSFTTALCDPIDDFEDYTSSGGDNWIADTWGAYNSYPEVPDINNGGEVYCQTTEDDPERVYEGDKSMQMRYDVWWTAEHYAFVQREFDPVRLDLTAHGSKSISIQYRAGEFDEPFENDTLYMELVDVCDVNARIDYPGDVCDPCWTRWYIALSEFTDDNTNIQLDKIKYVRIGAETDHSSGSCNTYWDSMMRCAPYCVPGEGPTGDISGPDDESDCVVDEWDLAELVARWLDEENLGDENFFQDDIIDFKDFAILANHWLEEQLWP
ncbi:hypothetical protein ACFL1G_00335 [Planctomycetota bacterium]